MAIHALGPFVLLRHARPVPACAWQSKKARDLLKILVARCGRPITRDALIEALWPDDDPSRTPNRLAVALSRVRAVLDPEHRGDRLVADMDAVRLDLSRLSIDACEFRATAESGLSLLREGSVKALERLAAAEVAYTGDFLEEDLYANWAVQPREELRALYVSVARALSDAAAGWGDHRSSIHYAFRILERDAYDEPAHLRLVSALAAAGRHGDARRAHGIYARRMTEIGVAATPISSAALGRPLSRP